MTTGHHTARRENGKNHVKYRAACSRIIITDNTRTRSFPYNPRTAIAQPTTVAPQLHIEAYKVTEFRTQQAMNTLSGRGEDDPNIASAACGFREPEYQYHIAP